MSNALNKVLLGKAETTPGSAVVLAAGTDAIRIISAKIDVLADVIVNKAVKQTFGDLPHQMATKGLQLDVEFYLRAGSGLGVSPDYAPILHCSNYTVTPTGGTDVVISPHTGVGSTRHTATFEYYEDGMKWSLVGAMATLKVDAPVNDWVKASASIFAPYADPVAASLPTGISFDASDPIAASQASVVTDVSAVQVGAFSFDTSASVEVRNLMGGSEARMTSRDKPTITMTKASLATAADFTRLTGMADGAFSAVFGSAGNRVTISAPRARYEKVASVEDGVNMNRDIVLALYETAGGGDDAYSIKID